MNTAAIHEWLKLTEQTHRNIFEETAKDIGLPAAAVEKDWWVVRTLELVFASSIAPHTVFKGGTSLSKAWKLIDRFSEDIDLALDRRLLGFDKADEEMTGSQVSKLRRLSAIIYYISVANLVNICDRIISFYVPIIAHIWDKLLLNAYSKLPTGNGAPLYAIGLNADRLWWK